jgi:hypothetical protein
MPALRRLGAIGLGGTALVSLAACNIDTSVGYVEIKTVPPSTSAALYLDAHRLEPLRNGTAVLRQKVGTLKLQADGDNGHPALLCNVVVQKNRITSVTVSVASRTARCQCARASVGADTPANRTCIA